LGNQIGYYDPSSGKLRAYPVPTPFAGPADLTFDSHGMLWFTEAYNESVARFDPATGKFDEYHFYSLDPNQYVGSPVGISVTEDGIVWVADHGGNWIVEFNSTSQHVTLYPTHFPPPEVYPISLVNDLLVDRQGKVWFTEHGGNSIGYFDSGTHKMVEFAIPTGPISTALWLAEAPNGDLWFTEWSSNKIGVLHANLPVPVDLSASESQLSLSVNGEASLSLVLSSSQDFIWSGTFEYSWPSYNQGDVNVTFTPQNTSLNGAGSSQTEATVRISQHVLPGEYVLGLGFDAGAVRVWVMVQTDISAGQTPFSVYAMNNLWLLVGVISIIILGIIMLTRRARRLRGGKRGISSTMLI
jgi:virginiamycin B lyase